MNTSKPVVIRSKRSLALLFVLVLPVMMFLRWDASPWLDQQVQTLSQQAGVQISYEQLFWRGWAIHAEQVTLSQSDLHSIKCDSLDVSLSISQLFSGHLAADIRLLWLNNPIALTVYQDGDLLHIDDVQADIDLLNLVDIQQNIPFRVSGKLDLQGSEAVDKSNGQAREGQLQLVWSQAMAGLAVPEFSLGDYTVDVYSDAANNAAWHWQLQGGEDVALQGKGMLDIQQPLLQQWTIHGVLDVQVDAANATLSMMLQAFTGSNKAKIRISGPLLRPQTQVVR